MKTKIVILLLSIFVIFSAYAASTYNFFISGDNWDANVNSSTPANDVWLFTGTLNLEDSRTSKYINNGYRGDLNGNFYSKLFGLFNTDNKLELYYKEDYNSSYNCGSGDNPLEIYYMSGKINSQYWGKMETSSDSYFCSNRYIHLKLNSHSLGYKDIGNNGSQNTTEDPFGKQHVYINGISSINGNIEDGILARGDQKINKVGVYIGEKTKIKKNINKKISLITKTYLNSQGNAAIGFGDTIDQFDSLEEKFYVYDYKNDNEQINLNGSTYINEGKKLEIDAGNTENIINVKGVHTVIVRNGNIYIKSNIKNNNDKKDLLILIAKKDKETGNGGNIYIDPSITNIDAILIADGSLITLKDNEIYDINNNLNELRKQLLIYGKVLTANTVGTDKIPYGADYYENSLFPGNIMNGSIYNLGNLRTFNLNYGGGNGVISGCSDENNLTPIETGKYSWAGQKECYNSDSTNNDLRGSDKINPLIIENNPNIIFINPYLFKN